MKKLTIFPAVLALLILELIFNINNCSAQWQPDVRLTTDSYTSNTSYNNAWCIASSGDSVHVVWYDDRDGNQEIYYKRSTDGGVSWGLDIRLTSNSSTSRFPSVSVSGPVVHVVWEEFRDGNLEIYYKRSTDGGISWGADTRLTISAGNSQNPSVSVSGLFVHVVWYDARDGNPEIYCKRSTDEGISWGGDTRLTTNAYNSNSPSVSVSGSVVHIVWYDNRDLNYEIYYKRSTDGGIIWGADTRLTSNSAGSGFPSVSVSGSVVNVVWHDDRDGNFEIYYKRSTDGGSSWGTDTRLTSNGDFSNSPSVSVSGSVVHVVWYDHRDGNVEIYYKRSTDGGISWGSDIRLTSMYGGSYYPSVSVSGSVVHVVWYDERDGNWEIYYKRDPTGNPVALNLGLTALLSGFYDGTTMIPDSVTVELHNSTTPYALVDSKKVLLDANGLGNPLYTTAVNGIPYYIVIRHRNGIETWSGTPQSFSSSLLNYDFTSAAGQAYGSNLVQIGTKWCLYVGDVNQDGVVDLLDMIVIDNDVANFITGYVVTDLNGDGSVDLLDMIICDNNVANFIAAIKPPGAMNGKIPRAY